VLRCRLLPRPLLLLLLLPFLLLLCLLLLCLLLVGGVLLVISSLCGLQGIQHRPAGAAVEPGVQVGLQHCGCCCLPCLTLKVGLSHVNFQRGMRACRGGG
jgi:hypothetical protein